jgi:putative CocE/NonD family hydrolase
MTLLTKAVSLALRLPRATHPQVVKQLGIPVVMSDGTVLRADRWFPEGHDGGLPTLLMRSPYGRAGTPLAFEAALFAERGFNVIVQSVRGTHGSEGPYEPFVHDQRDGADTVAWVRSQPWCDGRVGMWGGSYCGYTMFAAAAAVESGQLQALDGGMTSADLRWLFNPYDVFTLQSAGGWIYGLDTQGRRGLLASLRHGRGAGPAMDRAAAHTPLREADVVLTGDAIPFFRDWVDSPWDADYWQAIDVRMGHETQTAPVLLHAGWFDIFGPTQLEDAAELLRRGRDVRVVVGPWNHAGGIPTRLKDMLHLFDETLRGGPAAADPRPVRVQLYGDKRWWALPTWPVPNEPATWFLTGEGRLSTEPGAETQRLEWVDDPTDPAPSCGGAILAKGGAVDNAVRESRADVLVFTSAPLADDLVVLGRPRVRLRADADVASYDVAVRLCVVDGKGVSRNVSDGLQRIGGGAADIEISMWPTGVRFAKGQRIRLQVAGALHPLYARNLHTGEDAATAASGMPAHQAVLLSPLTPARLELPTVALNDFDLAR